MIWNYMRGGISKHESLMLKVLFNNISSFKNMSCIALHAISVFDEV